MTRIHQFNLIYLSIFLLIYSVFSCRTRPLQGPPGLRPSLPFETLDTGILINPAGEHLVFTDRKTWTEFWDSHTNAYINDRRAPAPEVDFSRYMLVGIFFGQDSGCQTIVSSVSRVETDSEGIHIIFHQIHNLGLCDMVVYPQQVIQIPRSALPVLFEETLD